MPGVLLALCLTASQNAPKPELSYYRDMFIVRNASKVIRQPVKNEIDTEPLSIAFRRNEHWAVWDDRGLTVRANKLVRSSRLEEISVSPRIFTKDEIRATIAAKRDRQARFLTGAKRLGTKTYFVPRWVDDAGKSWLECLVEVDLTAANPKPKLLGRLPGNSPASLGIDSMLFTIDGKLAVPIQKPTEWGIASWNLGANAWDFKKLGTRLVSLTAAGNAIEQSDSGTFTASRLNLTTGARQLLFESRRPIRFLDDQSPAFILEKGPSPRIINAETATVGTLRQSTFARRVGDFIVGYEGEKEPTAATLYRVEDWSPLASWKKD